MLGSWYLTIWPYFAVRWYVRHLSQHQNRRRLWTSAQLRELYERNRELYREKQAFIV
jgi:shikimate kinase